MVVGCISIELIHLHDVGTMTSETMTKRGASNCSAQISCCTLFERNHGLSGLPTSFKIVYAAKSCHSLVFGSNS